MEIGLLHLATKRHDIELALNERMQKLCGMRVDTIAHGTVLLATVIDERSALIDG
jgi:hypothetical protein